MAPFSKTFNIDQGIFTAASVDLNLSSDLSTGNPALIDALTTNKPFPAGDINLGQVSAAGDTGSVSVLPATIQSGGSVTFDLKATAESGVAIYNASADAIAALKLTNTTSLQITDEPSTRYALMNFGYSAALSATGSQPIGVVGSATLKVAAGVDSVFALLHGFPATTGADTALADAFTSWRLPCHVGIPGKVLNLKPRTWIIYELDGSVGLTIGSTLGWDMSYAHQLSFPTLPDVAPVSHDLSVKIDAGLTASFGFTAEGKYLVLVANESDDTASTKVRLALYKQSSSDFNFGLNLSAGVQGNISGLTPNFSDLIAATFGQEGQQVLADVETWAKDPTSGKAISGLLGDALNGTGTANLLETDLLTALGKVGITPADFTAAKADIADAISKWNTLASDLSPNSSAKLAAMLWTFLGKQSSAAGDGITAFTTFLTDLQSSPATTFADTLKATNFGDSDAGKFLESIADEGLLSLTNSYPAIGTTAGKVLDILNGSLIQKLQTFISSKIDLSQITAVAADVENVGPWLQNRLATFLGKAFDQPALLDLAAGIKNLDANIQNYYTEGVNALTKKYSIEFAATFDKATTDTALIDATFDLSKPAAADLFYQMVEDAKFDALLTQPTDGVTLTLATLTHEIKRTGTIDLKMPSFDFTVKSVNNSTLTLNAKTQGTAVLLYNIDATDSVTRSNSIATQLSVLASLEFVGGKPALTNDGGVAYELRLAQANMGPKGLLARTQPFALEYLTNLFPAASAASSLAAFWSTVLTAPHDAAISMQLNLPASILNGWFTPRTAGTLVTDRQAVSLALQKAWRKILPAIHFENLNNYTEGSGADALLVWSSMPVATDATIDEAGDFSIQVGGGKSIYWDNVDPDIRAAMSTYAGTGVIPGTTHTLAQKLQLIHPQVVEAGVSNVDYLDPSLAAKMVPGSESGAFTQFDNTLSNLLQVESELVTGATTALSQVAAAVNVGAVKPTDAIKLLSAAFATLTETLDRTPGATYFTDIAADIVAPLLLVEASAVLGSVAAHPSAMLSFYALNPGHTFDLTKFVGGTNPTAAQGAVVQTLVNLQQ